MTPQPRHHVWTGFEKHSLLCLLCRGIHITGFSDAEEEVEFGRSVNIKKKKQELVKVDSKKAYMDVSTALNNTVHNRDFQGDIPHKEVALMIDEILNNKKGAMFVIERQHVGRITRSTKRVFDRGISFIGDQREWKAGRKDREERLRLERMSNTAHTADDDAMDVDVGPTSQDVTAVTDNGWAALGAENAAVVDHIQSIDAIGDDWGGDATGVADTIAQAALGDEWGGSRATALSTTSALAHIQGVSDEWGGFGNETTTTTSTSTQIQAIEDEWGSSAGATSPISPALIINQTVGRDWTESGGLTSTEERASFGDRSIVDDRRDPGGATSNESPGLGRYQTVASFAVGSGGASFAMDPDLVEMQSKDGSGSTGSTSTTTPAFVTRQTATVACGDPGSAVFTTPTATMSQTRSETWGVFESGTATIVSAPGQEVGDDWGGIGNAILTTRISPTVRSQVLDANLNEFGRDAITIAADTTGTQKSNDTTGATNVKSAANVLSSMESLWDSSCSQADDTRSKTAVDGMGSGPSSMLATKATRIGKMDDALNVWDQPLPSTEKLTAKSTPSLSQDSWGAPPSSSTNNRSSSGTFSQSDNEDGWGGESSRSTSFTLQRDVRSMAPSPDITGRDEFSPFLSQNSTVLASTDIMEVDDDWGAVRTDKQVTFNDDGNWPSSMTVDPRGVKTLGQVTFSTPTKLACGELLASITHPNRRQQLSSEKDSNLASWPTTGPPTPGKSTVTCSPSIANAGINPERLAMLVTSNQDAYADAETPDLGAESEKQKNSTRGKSDKNSNYIDLPFNRINKIHGVRD